MNLLLPTQSGKLIRSERGFRKRYSNLHVYSKLFLLLIGGIFCGYHGGAQGTWSPLAHAAPHANEGVMLVLTDGTIMCKNSTGGSYGTGWDKLTPDSHGSYLNGTWTSLSSMHDDRLYCSAQVLPNGSVYTAGGEYGSGGNNAEVYNPQTNTWSTPLAIPLEQIRDANSEILANGDVLQAVVVDTVPPNEYLSLKTYLYNPSTNSYSAGPNTTGTDNESVWVKLPDGSVIYINRLSTNAERYIPATNTWIADATVPVDVYDPYGDEAGAAFLLPNGKVLFIGSSPTTALYTPSPSGGAAMGSWVTGPNFPNAPQGAPDAPAAMMVNGNILCVVSPTPTSGDHFPDSSVFYEYNYSTNSFTTVTTPFGGTLVSGLPTYIQNMVCLPNGTILYSYQGSTQYYIYTPGSAALAAGQPTVSNIVTQGSGCDTFLAIGTLFNGISEGAAYGDDWQMSSNYPLVRLTSGTNVYYARTYNWNRVGAVMTGAAVDSVRFILPATLPTGTYTLQVVANGNASAGTTFNTCGVACSAPPISGSSSVCIGTTTGLSDATTGGSWSSGNPSVATINSASGTILGVAAGTAVITYTASTCTATMIVTVNAAASAITGSVVVCAGSTITLNDITTGGAWTSGNASVATIDGVLGVVSPVGPGTTTITYSPASGCPATAVVTVNSLPAPITGSAAICAGATNTLGDATSGGVWSVDNPSVATVSAAGMETGVGQGTANITYSTGTGCLSTTVATVNAMPSAITGSSATCVGSTLSLSDGTSGGTWTSSNTAVANVDPVAGNVSALSSGVTTIAYTLSTGCMTSVVIPVNSLPSGIAGSSVVCAGSTIALTDVTSGGAWSSGSAGIANVSSLGVVNGITAGTAVISYTVTNGCGTNSATQTVTVNPATVAGTITGTLSVCSGSTTTLSDLTSGGVWSSSSTKVNVDGASGAVTGVATGTASVSYTVTGGCGTAVATAVVTVNTIPLAGTITGTLSVCVSATTALADGTSGGVWSSGSPGIASVSTVGVVNGESAGTATISYTATNTCGSATATTIVTVNAAPSAGTITGTLSVCVGATTALGDGTIGGAWSSSNNSIASVGTTGATKGVAAGTATISYTVTNTCGTARATSIVTVNAAPTAAAITGTLTVCIGATTTLSDATTGGVWNSSNASVANVSTAGAVTGIGAGTSTISYTVTKTCGSATATKVVTVSAAPSAGTISGGTSAVCVSATTTLSDATTGGVWSSSNTRASVTTAGVVRGVAAGTATISYTVTKTCGSAVATKVVTVSATPTVAAISGSATVAVAATIALTDATTGGVWSSSNTKATVTTAGVVRGVATGSATISYSVTNSCGTGRATKAITITAKGGRESSPTATSAAPVENSLRIFPNPTSGTFTVTTPNAGVLHLVSMEGKEVGQFDIKDLTSSFNIPDGLAPGVYIYQFIDGNGSVTSGRLVYTPR